jgi:hypothetical protein
MLPLTKMVGSWLHLLAKPTLEKVHVLSNVLTRDSNITVKSPSPLSLANTPRKAGRGFSFRGLALSMRLLNSPQSAGANTPPGTPKRGRRGYSSDNGDDDGATPTFAPAITASHQQQTTAQRRRSSVFGETMQSTVTELHKTASLKPTGFEDVGAEPVDADVWQVGLHHAVDRYDTICVL